MMITDSELVEKAIEARELSYSPYSGYQVGAALLCADGTVYTGCNIENVGFTPTICAERTAFFKAVSEGRRGFLKIAVAGGPKGSVAEFCTPCGVCRQVMLEFCDPDKFEILLTDGKGAIRTYTLGQMLPYSFTSLTS